VRYVLPLLALALLPACGSPKKHAAPRYDRAKVVRCLRAGASSFARAGAAVVRVDVSGERRFATLAEIDVAFGQDAKQALARLRARYFFRSNPKARPYVHGRFTGNVAYAITTLPFSKHGPKGLDAARARVRARAEHLVEGCLSKSRL
jgi:hypothetical protein